MKNREELLDKFKEYFWRYGVISIPDLNGIAHSFMDYLNENNVTYQFEFIKLDQFNFFVVSKL